MALEAAGTTNGNGSGERRYDAVIVGAGFAGMYMLYKLRELGLLGAGDRARRRCRRHVVLEPLPGRPLRRREPELLVLLRRASSSRTGPGASGTRRSPRSWRTPNHVADRFDLRKDIEFETQRRTGGVGRRTPAAGRSPPRRARPSRRSSTSWRRAACRTRSCPRSRASRASPGPTYHTGHWPHEGVDFTGLRVGVIGTGSSGIQSIPIIAEQAAHLTVFQRTPNFSMPAGNRPLAARRSADMKARYPRASRRRPARRASACRPRSRRTRRSRSPRRSATPCTRRAGTRATSSACCSRFNDLITNKEANDTAAEFIRNKIRAHRQGSADGRGPVPLRPPVGTKRPCLDTGYYETYNRDNVDARQPAAHPDRRDHADRHPHHRARSSTFDAIVFATGFDAMTGALVAVDIRGPRRRSR